MFIQGGFQTMPSKANDFNMDDDMDEFGPAPGSKLPKNPPPDDDAPF